MVHANIFRQHLQIPPMSQNWRWNGKKGFMPRKRERSPDPNKENDRVENAQMFAMVVQNCRVIGITLIHDFHQKR